MTGMFLARTSRTVADPPSNQSVNTKPAAPYRQRANQGLFQKNQWLCECRPRLPAEHFQVKKQSENYGRWFYTCQNTKGGPQSCGFFLWAEDARKREESAVLAASHSEAPMQNHAINEGQKASDLVTGDTETEGGYETAKEVWSNPQPLSYHPANLKKNEGAMRGREAANHAVVTGKPETTSARGSVDRNQQARSPKRKLPWLNISDSDEYGDGDLDGDSGAEEAQKAMQQTESTLPETPRKIRKTAQISSTGLATPATTPHNKQSIVDKTLTAPGPLRLRESLNVSFQAIVSKHNLMLPAAAADEMKLLFNKYEAQYQGAVKGRDVARNAITARDSTIQEREKEVLNVGHMLLEAKKEITRLNMQAESQATVKRAVRADVLLERQRKSESAKKVYA